MSKRKPIIAMDISSSGKGGGPYTSTMNLINSSLKESYDYRLFTYKTELGRFVSIKRIRDLVLQLKDIKPDIVHFTGLQLSGFHIAVACRLAGIKRNIVVIHGSSTEAMNIGRIKRCLIYIMENITLAITSTFYGVSSYSSTIRVTRPFQKKSSGFVYNLPAMSAKNGVDLTKEDIGFEANDIVVVSVARITRDKGYHILAESIKSCLGIPRIKFLIIGKGDYLPEMQQKLSEQEKAGLVRFMGYRSDVFSILPACDIFVLPTLHETLSVALLEASVAKLPLIASNVGGVPEIITPGLNGLLVPAADPEALAVAIKKVASDDMMRKNMGAEAKKRIEDEFSENSIVKRVDEIYKTLLKEK